MACLYVVDEAGDRATRLAGRAFVDFIAAELQKEPLDFVAAT
jgi:hypothetical protein